MTIPAELVALARSGAYLSLCDGSEAIVSLVTGPDRETNTNRYIAPFAMLDDARSLLDVLGWTERDMETPVEVDLRLHRTALVAALGQQREAEEGYAEQTEPGADPNPAVAQIKVAKLRAFLGHVEEA